VLPIRKNITPHRATMIDSDIKDDVSSNIAPRTIR
jgi:hypothetical protein